jgi:hypothetical protein
MVQRLCEFGLIGNFGDIDDIWLFFNILFLFFGYFYIFLQGHVDLENIPLRKDALRFLEPAIEVFYLIFHNNSFRIVSEIMNYFVPNTKSCKKDKT